MRKSSWDRALDLIKPGESIEDQNRWHLYGEIAWYGVLFGMIQAFLPVFVLRLGGSDVHVGLVTALPALIIAVFSMPGSLLVERERKPLSALIFSALIQRSGYLAIALVPFFFVTHRADLVIVLIGLLSIPLAIAAIGFTAMFARAVKPERRAHVVSIRNVWLGVSSTAVALLGGRFLDWVVFPLNFQILFAIGFLAGMVGLYHLARLHVPNEPSVAPTRTRLSWRATLTMVTTQRAFARYAITLFIYHWGLFFAAPLFTIYWVRNLGASDGWIGIINMVTNATTIIAFPLWGRAATRQGNRRVLILTSAALASIPIVTAFAPSLETLLFVAFLGGVIAPGFSLAFFNGLLEACPEQHRATYVGAFNALINVAAFLAPILSSSLTVLFSVPLLLVVAGAMRLTGAILIWRGRALAP
ncbi:MAG: MFS transporter [Chloroflexi bacterium]|nr:MFS transporter [Chloroflexota bacterium]